MRFGLTYGQLAESLRVPLSSISVAATGLRNLPKAKEAILKKRLAAPAQSVEANTTDRMVFAYYTASFIEQDLKKLRAKREAAAQKLEKMQAAFLRIKKDRNVLTDYANALEKCDVPVSVKRTITRNALMKDSQLHRADLHQILKWRASLAELDTQMKVYNDAWAEKRLSS
jgi:hypothetical protein